MRVFPKNIKIFITSRNTSEIRIARTQLSVIEKSSIDPYIIKDAYKLLNNKMKTLSPSEQNHIKRLFQTSDIPTALLKAVKYTKREYVTFKERLNGVVTK